MYPSRLRLLFPIVLVLSVSLPLWAQKNPRTTAKFESSGKFVMIEYGRPSLKGRDMLSQAQTGKVWRMGADKSTTLTSSAKLSFGKTNFAAGSYSLWLRKIDEKTFHLVFNRAVGGWGTEYDPTQNVDSVPLDWSEGSESVEQFTINLNQVGKGGVLELLWGKTVLKADFVLN
ncbi:MAG: DUF2911 domain-containing protein [Acidobacteriota bacterium]